MQFVNPFYVVRDLDLVKQITVKDFDHFLDHAGIIDETIDPLFGKNLVSLKGYPVVFFLLFFKIISCSYKN
jgi:cytochrome P450 family 9